MPILLSLFLLYVGANFYSFLMMDKLGYVVFESVEHYVKVNNYDFLEFIVVFFALFFLCLLVTRLPSLRVLRCEERDWKCLSNLMIVSCSVSFMGTFFFNLNIAGVDNQGDVSLFIKLISLMLNPDYLVPIFLVLPFSSLKRYLFVGIVFCVCMIFRGWMGVVLILFVCFGLNYCLFSQLWPKRTKSIMILLLLLVLLMLPVLYYMKHYFREPSASFIGGLIYLYNSEILSLYSLVIKESILRFQSFDMHILLMDNLNSLKSLYVLGSITPSFYDNVIGYVGQTWGESSPLGRVFASYLVGEDLMWSTHPGMLGWYQIEGFTYLFFSLVSFFTYNFIIFCFAGNRGIQYLSIFYLMLYLWHGWMSAYINCLIFLVLFCVYFSIIRIVNRVSRHAG